MQVSRWLLAVVVGGALGAAAPAEADLVTLTSGRVVSAAKVVFAADLVTITLRGGGDVTCDRSLVVRVDPDEVPWIDPAAAAMEAAVGAAAAIAPAAVPAPKPIEIPAAYRAIITRVAAAHQVDARLVHAVISVESAYRPRARSRKGARGLMQLMPATARQYGVRNAYHAAANIEAGVRHLKSLLSRFAPREALAAYNAGEATVRRFGGVPPFPETRTYVARVLAIAGLDVPVDAPEPPPPAEPEEDRSGS